MSELLVGELLLALAALLGATYLLGGLLSRWRIPVILGALLVSMAAHHTPLGRELLTPPLYPVFSFIGDIGVLLLLFFIGLQVDLGEMRRQGRDIVWLTVLNTALPFVLGAAFMLGLGYGWMLAFVIGLTCMPTAEAVIVPVLDEFDLIGTRVGRFIVGAGVMDDVIEVFLVAVVSVWIGEQAATGGLAGLVHNALGGVALAVALFLGAAWLAYRWILPSIHGWLPARPQHLAMLAMLVLLLFGGFAEYSGLGMVVGAITAGVLMRPVHNALQEVGSMTTGAIRTLTYGFFGPVFFFWVGLSVDLASMLREPLLALGIFIAATLGKLIGSLLMVPLKKLRLLEGWVVGVGLNARLTTEIIVAKLLLDARLIDTHLFTALVAAASLSTLVVPLAFSWLVNRHGVTLHEQAAHREPAHDG